MELASSRKTKALELNETYNLFNNITVSISLKENKGNSLYMVFSGSSFEDLERT